MAIADKGELRKKESKSASFLARRQSLAFTRSQSMSLDEHPLPPRVGEDGETYEDYDRPSGEARNAFEEDEVHAEEVNVDGDAAESKVMDRRQRARLMHVQWKQAMEGQREIRKKQLKKDGKAKKR
jgi:hypothetical protein